MRILVTGAAGFVGYAVAALLADDGHDVTGLTRSPNAALPAGAHRHVGDIRDPGTAAQTATFDGVCHLAGLAQVRESRTDPLATGTPTSAACSPFWSGYRRPAPTA